MELTKDLAYLLGVYMGDGSIWDNGQNVLVFGIQVQDKDFAEAVASSIGEIVGRLPVIHACYRPNRKSPYFRCQTSNKRLVSFLMEHSHAKTIIPKIVLDANDCLRKEFIAGLLDSEGYVSMSKRHMYGDHEIFDMQIGFSVCDPWIYEFREMLVRMGIKCSTVARYDAPHVTTRTAYRFTINKRSFIENGLYFKINRKQSRIDYYTTLFQSSTTRRGIPFTDEHKKRISKSRNGMQFTDEHKTHLSHARQHWIAEHTEIARDSLGRFVKR